MLQIMNNIIAYVKRYGNFYLGYFSHKLLAGAMPAWAKKTQLESWVVSLRDRRPAQGGRAVPDFIRRKPLRGYTRVDTIRLYDVDTWRNIVVAASLTTEQTVRAWGNSLAIRITGQFAKAAHLAEGVPVTLEMRGDELVVKAVQRKASLTLAQKLALFDPALHSGDMESSGRVGAEVF